MAMNDIDFRVLLLVSAGCFLLGLAIDYFTGLHWLPAGLFVLSAVWFNGVVASIEDRQPGGWDHVGNDKPIPDAEFKKMLNMQKLCTLIIFVLAILSLAFTSN